MSTQQNPGESAALKRALLAIKELRSKLEAAERSRREPIAIVGMGCRFPGGAVDADTYWQLLREGVDAVIPVPKDRWDADAVYDEDPDAPGKTYSRHGGFLTGAIDQFDASLFGISPREASSLDPQQRLLLEVAWEAIEDAGQDFSRLNGSDTGVYIGICSNDYSQMQISYGAAMMMDPYSATGNANSVAAGRLAYVLGLHGPTIAVDTACSSSLVVVQLACQALRDGQCRMALAGGVNLLISPVSTICMSKVRALSIQGKCRTFDASADGYIRGEGAGLIVLKRLSDAQADGDRILAVVRGAAVNHDGRSSGLTVPNGHAQQAVIRAALDDAGLDPLDISYVEAHGTGTAVGDPIEVRALVGALCEGRTADRPLTISAVKPNIGHLEGAAGISGLIKVILSLSRREIAPLLHLQQLSPHVEWASLPIQIPTAVTPWDGQGRSRIAGVNSFGIGGTNAHIIIEEAPVAPTVESTARPYHLLTLSAKTPSVVQALAGRIEKHLATHQDNLADVCFTLNATRAQLSSRAALVVRDVDDARTQLKTLAQAPAASAGIREWPGVSRAKVAFLFTGQGSQYVGMGRTLYETQPIFQDAMNRASAILSPLLGRDFLGVMLGRDADAESCLHQTGWTQPSLFAFEYALAQLWRSWGVEPSVLLGHSVGEYAAACVAGVFSLEDGLQLIAARGRLMQALPAGGKMAAILTAEDAVRARIASTPMVSVAAINGPSNVVISGSGADVDRLVAGFERDGIACRELQVSHAFHSPLMNPMLDEFEAVARRTPYSAPRVPTVSNVSGRLASGFDATYWRKHVSAPVNFAAGVQELVEKGCTILLEIGPSPVLLGMAGRCLGAASVASLPSIRTGRDELLQMLESAGEMYLHGVSLDWVGMERGEQRRKLSLPTYPFERQRFWFDAAAALASRSTEETGQWAHPLLGARWRSPGLDRVVFQAEMWPTRMTDVSDHVVQSMCVFPAAGYIEAMQSAIRLTSGEGSELRDLAIEEPLLLADDQRRIVQTIVTPAAGSEPVKVEIFSAPVGENDPVWATHVRATFGPTDRTQPTSDLDAIRERCPASIGITRLYEELSARGFEYGPMYRVVQELWGGQNEALGRLELPATATVRASKMLVHPGLLDGALQVLGAALAPGLEKALFLPVGAQRVRHLAPVTTSAWAHVRVRTDAMSADTIVADVALLDDSGRVLVAIDAFTAKRVDVSALARLGGARLDEWFYRVEWHEAAAAAPQAGPARWVVIASNEEACAPLVKALPSSQPHTVVLPGADLTRIVADLNLPSGSTCGVVFVASEGATDARQSSDTPGAHETERLLTVVQTLAASGTPDLFKMWVVTRGAQEVVGSIGPDAIRQSPLVGLCRVAASEYPELGCVRVDLDPHGTTYDWQLLIDEVNSGHAEPEVAFRGGRRFLRRLMPARPGGPSRDLLVVPANESFRVGVTTRGVIDNMVVQPLPLREPGPGEVEVRVAATGLNFRDVLNVLGMYPGDPGPLGGEFAGQVIRVGPGVTDLREGDEVLGIAGGTFASHVVVNAAMVVRRPSWMTVAEAASLPITYVTAWYGLHHLARIKPGDRVLVHAAAGGVGIAAVQIARRAGARVFGTAGSPEKRRFAESLGVEQVYSSRTADFAPALNTATSGQGVNIVLNALTGEFISKSLAALAPGGTFLEIGKAEIWSDDQVKAINPTLRYVPYDLAEIVMSDPAMIGAILRELIAALEDGSIRLMPFRTFDVREARIAFRYMAQARHIGKIVMLLPAFGAGDQVSRDGSYLVTGGLGALGLRVGRLLVERGAGTVFLLGRSAPTPAVTAEIEEMRRMGGDVRVIRGDVSNEPSLRGAFAEIDASGLPLRGVFHAAGIVDDAVLSEQNGERLTAVLAPKANGAALLDRLTAGRSLGQFVMFSSVASVFGPPSQGPYAAANATLDVVAARRRALGRAAQSLNWGPWEEAGMAANLAGDRKERMAQQGFGMIPTDRGLTALLRAMAANETQLAIMPVEWGRVLRGDNDAAPPLLRDLAPLIQRDQRKSASTAAVVRLADQLKDTPPSEWRDAVAVFVRQQVAKVLALPSGDSLGDQTPLTNMGIDSLMAIELRNALGAAVGKTLPASLVYDRPTIDALAEHLLGMLAPAPPRPTMTYEERVVTTSAQTPAAIEGLSQEQLAALLADRLATLGKDRS
jgi:acyl transferase domain-containing protein/NADPH:quinone reductase-like Zn-dependent oxidoreductase